MTFERVTILALLLVLVVVLLRPRQAVSIELPNTPSQNGQGDRPAVAGGDILAAIHSRKSVRRYTDEPVSLEELHTLVRAGFAAPSGANKQPWEFVVVTERERLDAMSRLLVWGKMLDKAPAAIVVCSNLRTIEDDIAVKLSMLDCAAACENILLAAEGTGLGAVWCAAYPYDENVAGIRKIAELPEEIIPVAVISVGRPTGADRPKNKYKPEKIHLQRWGDSFPE